MDATQLVAFERRVANAFEEKRIPGPIHLAGGNENQLIQIFKNISREDWVLSTWRSHYHALLHRVPPQLVMDEILAGRSMLLNFPEYRFMSSAIMGGMPAIACGFAAAGKRVWCFVGDMAATGGAFFEAARYASGHNLSVKFVVEDNGLSTNTPTRKVWGEFPQDNLTIYAYTRTQHHCGTGTYVSF